MGGAAGSCTVRRVPAAATLPRCCGGAVVAGPETTTTPRGSPCLPSDRSEYRKRTLRLLALPGELRGAEGSGSSGVSRVVAVHREPFLGLLERVEEGLTSRPETREVLPALPQAQELPLRMYVGGRDKWAAPWS